MHKDCDVCLLDDIKNEKKENIKTKIQSVFTKLRNELNNREDKLLLEADEIFNRIYCHENIIKEGVKLPEKIKILLVKKSRKYK